MTIDEQIALINDKVDLLDYVSQYTDFKRQGGEYWALSPLTDERTPSFSINTDKFDRQKWKDFSSGGSGDIVDFVKAYEHVGTKRAIEILSAYAGIDGEELRRKTHLDAFDVARRFGGSSGSRKRKTEASGHRILQNDYMDRFEEDHPALQLWRDEGITDLTMDRFEVRFDVFTNRIVFPLRDAEGNIINVIGRTVDPDFKAKNLRKYTYYFPLGNLDVLFGYELARYAIDVTNEIILFESAKSVMLCDGWGIHNTCAILTSHLNDYQRKFLIKLGRPVVFALDKDANPFVDKNVMKLKRYCNVSVTIDTEGVLDEKDSPADKGKDIFVKLYNERIEL